jgi:hypothetical protein
MLQGGQTSFAFKGQASEADVEIEEVEFSVGGGRSASAFRARIFNEDECSALIEEAERHAATRPGGWTRER